MLRKISTLISILMLAALAMATPATHADAISGEWHVVFSVAGHTAEGTMTFAVDGDKVTGTVVTEHTGPGTVSNGKWSDGKLSFTADFKTHESIEIRGTVKDGKLEGTFTTEGNTGTWTATKK